MLLTNQRDPRINPLDSPYKTSTKSVVLELFQSVESKLASWNQVWSSLSLPLTSPLNANQSKCITNPSKKPSQEIMLDSTLRISQSRISEEDMLPQTPRTTQLRIPLPSSLKSSSWTTPVKSKRDTLQSSIATPPILLASSTKSNQRSTEELVRSLKLNPRLLNQVMPLWLECYHKSQCALKLSINTHPSEDSPSETWNKPLPSVSSRKSQRKSKPVRPPKLPKRKENEQLQGFFY